ncbi:hypothetical protein PHLCEN_2v3761 [Hermanssonia centrifuga]|uniref:EF-hand domain-containing protein n=1 Tax=Hermanssonia centrifuga TaxID=98765 RepID=A0A2R6QBH8_9APHY|nr:hypothetical protein PHLCEN_2v3761 [Hermanssonia centrifuga]
MVIEVFRKEWTPWGESQLARKVEEKGGVKFVENSDTMLSELANWDAGAGAGQKETNGAGHAARLQGRTVKSSSLTLQDLKDELFEDWESAVQKNMETFEGKFALHQRQLQEELARFIREENNRLIDEVNKGPHDKIKNEELKAIWKEMDWKLNVKARLFVMTLRDHYKDKAESAAMSPFVQSPRSSQRSDDWAFEFINAKYLQPIMEAFDDDGSGYVTYQEVNEFVESRPLSLNWSLPHWVAYWAIGWQIISSRYRDRIVGLFEQMFAMRCELRPENRYWADYYLSNVWPVAFELTQSLRPANVAEHIEDKFQTYADFEEERIRKNLEDIRFDIDALDTVYVVAGPGRIEKYCFPLIYLLLKRDIEVFRIARTKVLHKEELLDSADSVLWVLKAVNYRYLDLSVLFKQNHLNVDSQMKITACGLFDYMHDSSSLWIWRNLQAIDENGSSDSSIEPNVCEWDRILNYPLQDGHSFKCSLYDTPLKQEVQADAHARMPVRAILGEWNGFVYNEDQYPAQLMTSFQAHAVPSDPLGFRASGIHDGVSFELSGRCHQGGDRTIKLTFIIRYSREYRPQYFTGYLDRSGSIVGTEGWEADECSHSNQFILKRLPARLLCYRPSPMKFEKNKARALWKYAIDVVLHEVRRHYWTWSYFSERRERRLRYIELSIRFSAYGHLPNERELVEWLIYKQSVLAVDASFYRILRDERLKIIPSHDCYCHGCGGKIGGSRLICLDCLSAEPEARTVDFCDNPECHQIVHAPNSNGDQPAKHHNPGHDVFKVRTVLHLRDVPRMSAMAGNALNVCREFFQNATPVIDTGLLATVHDNDAIRDTLASYFDEPAVQPTLSSSLTNIQCRICQHAVQQPCWFCVDCFALEEEVYICDDCETKTLLQCTHCQKPYKQPSWYYGSHPSDNFMCNTCNWNRTEAPDVVRSKQHTYLHALVRCTSKAENEDDQGPPSTDQRIMALERTVGALDGKMGRLEEALSRIERLLVTNLSTNSTQGEHSAALCARCRTFIPPEVV